MVRELRIGSFKDLVKRKTFLRRFFSTIVPITTWLPDINHNIKCPFHDDSTASARIYHDKDCVRLWCFGCGKQYTSYDYVGMILGIEPEVFLRQKYTEEVLDNMVRGFGKFELEVVSYPIEEKIRKHSMGGVLNLDNFLKEVYHVS